MRVGMSAPLSWQDSSEGTSILVNILCVELKLLVCFFSPGKENNPDNELF